MASSAETGVPRSAYKAFVSGTFLDIRDYRRAACDALRAGGWLPIEMQDFGADPRDPATFSVDRLRECQAYVLILGHRYGSIAHRDAAGRSVTHCEYDEAFKLYREKRLSTLLVYCLADDTALAAALIEGDEKRQKLKKLKSRIKEEHLVRTVSAPHELAARLVSDLEQSGAPRAARGLTLIATDEEVESVQSVIDLGVKDRLSMIADILEFMAGTFGTLFHIDRQQLDLHPLFSGIQKKLGETIPGIVLAAADGRITRATVRHVVFRTETARIMMKAIPDEKLEEVGRQIGDGAARDLFEKTLRPSGCVPASPEVFVRLWDFWDRTGGWGRLDLDRGVDRSQVVRSQADRGQEEPNERKWRLLVRNSFLDVDGESQETKRLCAFWRGYIFGFLDAALPRLGELMRALDGTVRALASLPEYCRVDSVTQLDDDGSQNHVFLVSFRPEPLSETIRDLSYAEQQLARGDAQGAGYGCKAAVESLRHYAGTKLEAHLDTLPLSNATRQSLDTFLSQLPIVPTGEQLEASIMALKEVVWLSSRKLGGAL